MKIALGNALAPALAALAWLALAQDPGRPPLGTRAPDVDAPQDRTLPNGKSQRDEILKAERDQNMKDAAQLVTLAQQVQLEIEKNDRYVLSISTLKKTDDIEKLAKKISSRMRHN
jgi:hypothetical protein